MALADRDCTRDLYALLRLSPTTPDEQLRYAYEQAMSAATRSTDLVRARVLLAAFQALPVERRRAMFGRGSVTQAPAPALATVTAKPPGRRRRPRRPPRARKWGMSFPIRMLVLLVVVPCFAIAILGTLTRRDWRGANDHVAQQPRIVGSVIPQNAGFSAADVAVAVDRHEGRDDVSCVPETVSAFACHASDGTAWSVSGTAVNDLAMSVVAQSVYWQSARLDAQLTVSAVESCRRIEGSAPSGFSATSTPVRFACAGAPFTFYLRPGDSVVYTRLAVDSYRLSVTAGDGETVTYDSHTRRYS